MSRKDVLKFCVLAVISATIAVAHPPHTHHQNRGPEISECIHDVLPLPYRSRFNRPRCFGGAIAWLIAPSSQEGLEWHEQLHRGSYSSKHCPPVCDKYYFPKTWDLIPMGPRSCPQALEADSTDDLMSHSDATVEEVEVEDVEVGP